MKFSVERDVLTDAVAWAARSLPLRPSAPVLAGLLVETDDSGDGLVLSTFDYETSARATVPASVQDDGKALVSGRLLADICRSLPNKPVHMALDGAKVVLTCGQAKFTLQTMPVDEYPTLPAMPESSGTVSSELFAQAVGQAVTAAGRDDMLPVLTGVRIEIDGEMMSLLATDRFRLSLRELTWNPDATDAEANALVPARVLADTARALTAGSTVTIALAGSGTGEGLIGFQGEVAGGVRRTTTRLLDGEFPRVRTLFPTEHRTVARLDRAAFIEAVKRVSLVAERNTAVQLMFDDNGLTLDAGHGDEAVATERIDAQVKGDPITTGFNPQFLLDGLTAIEQPVVEVAFTLPAKPAVITGIPDGDGERDTAFQYLLMPRRLLG
ncbi:MAG: DNA polymerase III beta subunit [uncultured Nocardioidaceae bacterium]|uniref:Beta sliding clamp n=1 Tax=uncultured Nocardioidaceae bacterium TaxID=253824 RepID=A0A6J4L399_9ACTN|nr:MAG: DNA polymerase III beta subunit [uncultured Nocardioidaceae bacterium]